MAAVVALFVSAAPSTVRAQSSTEQARDYLLGSQDARGSWGGSREATSLRDTATVLDALRALGVGDVPEAAAGYAWLAGEQRRNTDDSARAITALHGTALQFAADDDRAVLLSARLPRSGWGLGLSDRELSAIDTALAARALAVDLGFDDQWYVLNALALEQNPDGGWGIDDESMVATTAEVVITLSQGELAVPEVGPTIDAAVAYLLSRQDIDGRIGAGPLETALAVRAILGSKRPAPAAAADALAYLLSEQFADGSWEGDSYTTAEVLLAFGEGGPNVALDSAGVTFTPSSATAGDAVDVEVTVRNFGAQGATAFVVRVYRGDPAAGHQIGGDLLVPGLAAGDSATFTVVFDTTGLAPGRAVTVLVDADDEVLEIDEDDNASQHWLEIALRKVVDLSVSSADIAFTPTPSFAGDPVAVSARVRNLGETDASNVTVAFYNGDPAAGGTLLSSHLAALVPASSDVLVTSDSAVFPVGAFPIHVVVDGAGAIAEDDESNNQASRVLTVTSDIDLLITDVSLSPSNVVEEGTPVQLTAVITNTGGATATGVEVQLVDTGEIIDVGTVGPGGSATAVFTIDTSPWSGSRNLDVRVDPANLVSEVNEANNRALALLILESPTDLFPGPITSPPPVTEGDTFSLTATVYNTGTASVSNVGLALYDAPPGPGANRVISPDPVLPSVGGGAPGAPGQSSAVISLNAAALGVGVHTLYLAVDPDGVHAEGNESNNVTSVTVDVRPKPDLSVKATDIAVTPSGTINAGDEVTITATIRNLEPSTLFQSSSPSLVWHIRLYDGDASTGTLIGQRTRTGFDPAETYTVSGTVDTTGRTGTLHVTVVADPAMAIPDRDPTNNTLHHSLSIAEPELPDLVVTLNDISFAPNPARADAPVDVTARIRNRGGQDAESVMVAFYNGDPDAGGVLLDSRLVPLVAAESQALVTVEGLTFPLGTIPIYVLVDDDDAVAESNEANNRAFRPLDVTEDIDLVVRNTNLTLSPSDVVDKGEPVQLTVVVENAGTEPALDVRVQLVDTGEIVDLGSIPGATTATALFSIDTTPFTGARDLEVVVDPADLVTELDEGNNRARALLVLRAPSDLFPGPIAARPPVTVGEPISFTATVFNTGEVGVSDVSLTLWDSAPGPGARRLIPDIVIPYVGAGIPGIGGQETRSITFSTGALGVGTHTLYLVVDGDNVHDEGDETNNTTTVDVDVRPDPDLSVAAADVIVNPPGPIESGDVVTVSATVRNLQPTTLFTRTSEAFRWRIQMYDGDAATGLLLAERLVQQFDPADSYAIAGTVDTAGRTGPLPVTIVAEPEGVIPDGDRSNNEHTELLDVSAATVPDLAIGRDDIRLTPARFTAGELVTIDATVFNLRDVAPGAPATVEFFLGDPDAGGVLLDTTSVSLAALGSATVSTTWDTTGTPPGATGIFVAIDREDAIVERDETNNIGARGAEVGLDDSHRPPVLSVTPASPNAELSWSAPAAPTNPVVGYYPLRDGVVAGLPRITSARVAATASHNAGTASRAIDGFNSTAWTVGNTSLPAWLEVDLGTPQYITAIWPRFGNGLPGHFDLQTWDGAQWVTHIEARDDGYITNPEYLELPAPVKSDRIRFLLLTGSLSRTFVSVVELRAQVFEPSPVTSAVDTDLLAGEYTYTVTAVDADGIESRPSDPAAATMTTVPAPIASSSVDGNDVTLSWDPDPSGRRTGVYVFRDGEYLDASSGVLNISATATFTANRPSTLVHRVADNNNGTYYRPAIGEPPPWIIEGRLPEPMPLAQFLVRWQEFSGTLDHARIETWDGTGWVEHDRFTVRRNQSTTVVLSEPVMTDRFRVVQDDPTSLARPRLARFLVYARAPLNAAADTYTDVGRAPGTLDYEVAAIDALGQMNRTPISASVGQLPAPTDVAATAMDRDVEVSWTELTETNVGGYRVYRNGVPVHEALVTGGVFIDVGVPDGTVVYEVAAVDLTGTEGLRSAPTAPITIGTVSPPTDLVASVDPLGNVGLLWTDSTGPVVGYHVYRDGARLTTTALPSASAADVLTATGEYVYTVTAVSSGGFESLPSNAAAVSYLDVTPPGAPPNLRMDAGVEWKIRWDANPAADAVVGYNVFRVDGPAVIAQLASLRTSTFYHQGSRTYGIPVYTWRVTAVDESGLEGPPAEIVLPIGAPPTPPATVTATGFGDHVELSFADWTGRAEKFGAKREGVPSELERVDLEASVASSEARAKSGATNVAAVDSAYWESLAEDAAPFIVIDQDGALVDVDAVSVAWLSEANMASAFTVTAELYDGTAVEILNVTGNSDTAAVYPIAPAVVARSLRLDVTGKNVAGESIGLWDFHAQRTAMRGSSPIDVPEPSPGAHDYTVFTVDIGGRRSADSAPPSELGEVDLTIDELADVEFSPDSVGPGDLVTVTVSVRNSGTVPFAGSADVELYRGVPGSAGSILIGSATLSAADVGERVSFAFPHTAEFIDEALYAFVDRADAIHERDETNNAAVRGVPLVLLHRTYAFTPGKITLFGYVDDTDLYVRDTTTGVPHFAGTLDKGDHVTVSAPEGMYQIFGSRKFSMLAGGTDVVGHYALDHENRAASTEFYTVAGQTGFGTGGEVIAFATEDDTEITFANSDTGVVIKQETVNRGEHVMVAGSEIRSAFWIHRWLHVTATKPVTVLAKSHVGYNAADVQGRFAGTEIHTVITDNLTGGSGGPPAPPTACIDELLVYAYKNNTFVRVVDKARERDGVVVLPDHPPGVVMVDVIDRGKTAHWCPGSGGNRFLRIEASAPVTATSTWYHKYDTNLDASVTSVDDIGFGIGTLGYGVVLPLLPGQVQDPYGIVWAYYDDTFVTFREVERSDGSPPRGEIGSVRLHDGDSIDLADAIDGTPIPGTFLPGRLIEIQSTRPISGRFGSGPASGDFYPVLWGDVHDPDLEVTPDAITVSVEDAAVGDVIELTAVVRNVGTRAAENFAVDIYDGDPDTGGSLLHRELETELLLGDTLSITIPYEVEPGFHEIHVVADPDNLVAERNEDNNRSSRLIATPPDLEPTIVALDPAAPLINDLVQVQTSIANTGGAHVLRADLQLFVGDPDAGGVEVASSTVSLMAGESRDVSLEWDASGFAPGYHTLFLVADGADQVAELDEDDNVDTVDAYLLDPDFDDLTVASLVFVPSSPFAATPATAEITVENRGRLVTGTAVRLLLDGAPVADDSIPFALDTAATHVFEIPLSIDTAGPHELTAVVDPDDLLLEVDETNNSQTLDVTVGDPKLTLDIALAPTTAGASDDVGISVALTNTDVARSGTLDLVVLDSVGDAIATVTADEPVSLADLGATTLPFVWNTGTTAPGPYSVEARYFEDDQIVALDAAPLEIVPETPVALVVVADRASYSVGETAEIATHITVDADANDALPGTPVLTEVLHPDGVTVLFAETQFVDLAPGSEHDVFTSWAIGTTPPAIYTARSTIVGQSATDDLPVDVSGPASVVASIAAAPNPVAVGTPLGVTVPVENVAGTDLVGATVEVRLIDATTSTVTATQTQTHDLLFGAPITAGYSFDIDALDPSHDHIALAEISHAGVAMATVFTPFAVITDADPPVVVVAGVVDGECSAPPVTPIITVTDANAFTTDITLDGAPYSSGTPVTADGLHVLAIHAEDVFGNATDVTVTFTVDGTPPVVALTGVTAGQIAQSITAGVSVTEDNPVAQTVTLDGAPYLPGTPIEVEGDHTLFAEVTDCAGNAGSATVSFTIDRTPPTIAFFDVVDGSLVNTDVTPVIAVSDPNLAATTITLDGAPFVSGTTVTAEGTHVLFVQASDAAGNTAEDSVSFTIDKTPPVITIEGVTEGQMAAAPVTPTFSATDLHLSSVSATLDGAPFSSGTSVGAEGTHILIVTATDGAGNVASSSVTFTIDLTAPVIEVTGVTDGEIRNAPVTPVVTFTDTHLATTTLTVNGAPFASGTTLTAEADYLLEATAADEAGNTSAVSVSFTIDTTPPEITIGGVTDGQCSAAALTPTYAATDLHLESVTATLDGAPFVSGTPVSAEGAHTLEVTATDTATNTSSASAGFIIDTTPPTIAIAGVADGDILATAVAPTVTIDDANLESSTLLLDGAPYTSGTPIDTDGDHTLSVTAVDCAGNTADTSISFTLDLTPPVIAINGVTDGELRNTPATITVTTFDITPVTLDLTLDAAPFVNGSTVSAEGAHTLIAVATDAAGNTATRSVSFTIDTTPPAIVLSGVADGDCATSVTPSFTVDDLHLDSVTATLNGAPFVSGTPVTAEGIHVLVIDAADLAGNTSSLTATFTVDNTPPAITVSGVSDGEFANTAVVPVVDIAEANLTSSSVQLDGAPFASSTPVTTEGAHVLEVTAADCAGQSAAVTVGFTLDFTPPEIAISGVADGQVSSTPLTPVVTFSDANLDSTVLTLDGAPFVSGTTVSADGSHVLFASATDRAGNTTTRTVSFAIDTLAPVITIAGVVDGQCSATPVTPTFTATDDNLASVTALLDGAAFSSGTTVSAEGSHLLEVTAVDLAANESSANVGFTIDATAPVITVAGVADGDVLTASPAPTIAIVDDNLVDADIRLDGLPYVSGTPITDEGAHVLAITATDCAGNEASVTISFALVLPDIDADTGRVLLAFETAPDAPFLRATLTAAGIGFDTAFGRDEWLAALRTGAYEIVVLYLPAPSESGSAMTELREVVAAGVGLILIKDHPDAMPKLRPALGAHFLGVTADATDVSLTAPLSPALVPIDGNTVALTLDGAVGAGLSSAGDTVAAASEYGAGKSIVLAWDTEHAPGPELEELYLAALDHVDPPDPLVVGGGLVSLRASLTAGIDADYRIELTLPAGVTLVAAMPAPDAPGLLSWTASLLAGAAFRVDARLQVPETPDTYTVIVTESQSIGGSFVTIGTDVEVYEVDRTADELAVAAIDALDALSLSGGDKARRRRAVDDLNDVLALGSSDADTAIGLVLDALDEINRIDSVDTTDIHVDVSRLLRIWQARSVL